MDEVKSWAFRNLKGDPIIWFIILLLSLISILVVYSATGTLAYKHMGGNTEYYLIKHSSLVAISLLFLWITHNIDYRYYARCSRFLLYISVPLLIFTWLFGININEASRWITIPIVNRAFQPSDLAKLALVVTLASMLSKRQKVIHHFQRAIIPMLLWIGIICGLIALTDISSAALLFFTCLIILYIGRVPVKFLILLVFIVSIFGAAALYLGQRKNTAISRMSDFIYGETPYQARHSYIAIASGGIFGKGPGLSEQRNFLPYPYSDFIYAIIIEEYGMIGGCIILLLYLILLYRSLEALKYHERAYAGLLSAGLSFSIVLQGLVNMGVAVGIGPVTGLSLPFVSMGGTSLLFTGISLGIILSISKEKVPIKI